LASFPEGPDESTLPAAVAAQGKVKKPTMELLAAKQGAGAENSDNFLPHPWQGVYNRKLNGQGTAAAGTHLPPAPIKHEGQTNDCQSCPSNCL